MEGAQVIMCPGNVNTFPINEVEKMRKRRALSDTKFAYLLLAPSLILLAALIGYPMLYNIYISVLDVPVNPRKPSVFVGLDNYISVLTDPSFYHSVITTLVFIFVVVVLSTVVGLAMACFLNRKFVGKKLVNSLIILSYVIPSVCLIFAWRYMFNNIYGIINYSKNHLEINPDGLNFYYVYSLRLRGFNYVIMTRENYRLRDFPIIFEKFQCIFHSFKVVANQSVV